MKIELKNSNGYKLVVQDDGIGLPHHVEPGNSTSFGMQLIDVFVKQLNGKLSIDRAHGTTVAIEFN